MSFSFGGASAAPAATTSGFGFGGAAPATTSAFGSTTAAPATGGFGFGSTAAAAPSTGGLFGSTAAPAATGGLFGSTAAPASTGGLFGSTAAPATGGFGFGTTPAPAAGAAAAPSAFGGFGFGTTPAPAATQPATGGFGFGAFGAAAPAAAAPAATTAPAAQQYPPQSVEARMAAIRAAYSPSSPECRFQTVFYNKVDSNTIAQYVKPAQANARLWEAAVANNPDPSALVPSLAVGFDDLHKRVAEQEKAAAAFTSTLDAMGSSLAAMVHGHEASTAASLAQLQRVHAQQSHRLLQLVNRVECARARDVAPRLPEELDYEHKLHVLERAITQPHPLSAKIQQLATAVKQLESRGSGADDAVATQSSNATAAWLLSDESANQKLFDFLKSQREALEHVTSLLKQDQRDLQTIQAVTQQAHGNM